MQGDARVRIKPLKEEGEKVSPWERKKDDPHFRAKNWRSVKMYQVRERIEVLKERYLALERLTGDDLVKEYENNHKGRRYKSRKRPSEAR
jgi:hypothetical protein